MLIIPAVDIMGGKCVRLVQGDPTKLKVYFNNPLEAAKLLEDQGAELIHLIDLDAALGSGQNMDSVEKILKDLRVKVQIGGGVRTIEKAETLLKLGASRVIFGTAAVQNPTLIEEAVRLYGSSRIAVAIDEKKDKVTFHGWKDQSEMNYLDLARCFETMEVGTIIFTSTSVDGTLKGPQVEKILRLVETVKMPVIASGGIASLNDLVELTGTGVYGVVVGTAFYEGNFTFKQALEVVKSVG
ncbi:MAG: 1-(5-phosphoribosyl)-5-[(5-phosphoribosylamino)methylideneamino]imidazole-4-carboxamide isomerase [Candidatus Bathyarchaeota archaeon]|nr:1-(5-phosphoribosyl)-5-[(5-phosphoribosylamino)methylideneamino]imidazole-4-carboxamide isomerase [Candidatus Bathyarchaeota archaeon]